MNWFYFPSLIKEYRVADEIPWGICSSGSESASWCSALRTSRMCKDNAGQGCSQLVSLRLPVCQRRWPLLSLCRRLREGFSEGVFFKHSIATSVNGCDVAVSSINICECLSTHSCFPRLGHVPPVSCSLMRSTLWLAPGQTVMELIAYRHASCLCCWMRWMGLVWRRWRGEGRRGSCRRREWKRLTHRSRSDIMEMNLTPLCIAERVTSVYLNLDLNHWRYRKYPRDKTPQITVRCLTSNSCSVAFAKATRLYMQSQSFSPHKIHFI